MPSGVSAGHDTRLYYHWEDNGFASSPNDSNAKPFGADPTVQTAEGSNAVQRVFRPGRRVGVDQIAMMFEGSFSIQFTLTNPWWFATLLGQPTQSGTGPTYTLTYDGAAQPDSVEGDEDPDTIAITLGHEQSGDNRVLRGCMVTSVEISVNVEEEVQISIDGAYADEELVADSLNTQPTTSYDPLTYAEGSLSVAGETEKYVQSASISIDNQVDPIRELGSRTPIDYNDKTLEPSVSLGKLFDGDHTNLEEMFGGSGTTTPQENADDNAVSLELTFDNGKSGGNGQNRGTFTVSGTLVDSYDEDGIGEPTADLEESINRSGLNPTLEWTNEEQEVA